MIIPAKNGARTLDEVLAALFDQVYAGALEVIIVDSGSRDGMLEIARRYPVRLHEIPPQDFGHGRTRNLGARLARGDYLAYLSQDAVPSSRDWLSRLASNLSEPDVAGVFSRQKPRVDCHPVHAYFLNTSYPEGQRQVRRLDPGTRVRLGDIFFSNVGSMIKKTVWNSYHFDETVVMSEDQHWARAVLSAGYSLVYDPGASVYHSHSYDLASVFRRNFDSGYSLRGLIQDEPAAAAQELARCCLEEVRFLTRTRRADLIPYAVVYEMCRIFGFFAGIRLSFLPLSLMRRMSLHRYYWEAPPRPPAADAGSRERAPAAKGPG